MVALAEAIGFAEAADLLKLNLATGTGYSVGSNNTATITIAQNGFTVTTTRDTGEGSLSQAVLNANAIAGADTITFGGSTFTDATPDTITLMSGLTLTENATITGTGASQLTVESGGDIFTINAGITANVSQLSLTSTSTSNGIANNGTASLNNLTFSSNGGEVGTSLSNNSTGTISVTNSTFNNSGGGGISNQAITLVSNSTFSGNSTGIGNSGTITTIVNNTIAGGGTGISNNSTIVNLYNNLLVGNASNTLPTATNSGNNLTGTFVALGVDSVLKDNGGSTQTHALLSDSAAANAGDTTKLPLDTADRDGDSNTTESIPFDQRGTGFNRVGGSTVEVGAYEVQAASNTAPVVTLAGTPLSYTENDAATLIDSTATVADTDSANFDTGTLTVNYSANGSADDRLAIRNQGTSTGQISVSGSTVAYEGTTISTVTGGTGTTALVITFNANATPTAVSALLQNLTYANVSEAPSTAARTVRFVVTDGDGGTSTAATKTINVTAVNDAATATNDTLSAIAEDSGVRIISFAGLLGNDSAGPVNESGQSLTITNISNVVGGTAVINGSNIEFTPTLNYNDPASFDYTVQDNGTTNGAADFKTATGTASFILSAVNDAPTLTGNATLPAVTQNTTNPSGSTITTLFGSLFSDVDTGASFSGLAIRGNTANSNTEGTWQYSINSTTWANIGTVADGSTALALAASTLVRFVPVGGYNGTPGGLTVRALDNTYSGGFSTGTTRVLVDTTSNGGSTAIAGTFASLGTSVMPSLPSLVWRNSGTGQNSVWQLNGFTVQTTNYINPVADPNWQIVSTADFNRDGIPDLVWRNKATGENSIWQMNDTSVQTTTSINSVADPNWQIVSTADFNRDGTPDLLWRNVKTGENSIWQMNGTTVQTTTYINPVNDPNWQIVGTADFNRDGTPDLLWRNQATGENSIWQMNGTTVQTTTLINPVGNTNWQIAGVANLNGDSTPDLLWRNKVTGENSIWQMNGTTVQTTTYINPVTDANWRVKPLMTA